MRIYFYEENAYFSFLEKKFKHINEKLNDISNFNNKNSNQE